MKALVSRGRRKRRQQKKVDDVAEYDRHQSLEKIDQH
jgi:hypothetical protein